MDALWLGCVPVIISDYYDLPLNGLIDWKDIAVFVRESQVVIYYKTRGIHPSFKDGNSIAIHVSISRFFWLFLYPSC